MIGMRLLIASAVLLSSLMFLGCEGTTKKLVGGYALERFNENGKYYLLAPGEQAVNGGGVFDGTVERIGWNQDWILAQVTKLYHGDTNGWYALNLTTKQIIGPFQESELKTNSIFSKIECYEPADVR